MIWLHWTMVGIFALLGAGCLLLIVMQLPGTWLILTLGLGVQLIDVAWIHGDDATAGWWGLGVGLVLAIVGEILEAVSGAAGAKVGGGTRRSMWGGFVGGVIGAILGTPLIPIPILGTFIGAIVGAFAGAMVGEVTGSNARSVAGAIAPATGAAAGRAVGTVVKMATGVAVWLIVIAGLSIR
ncbi:MAG: DUF456 domain-containing protein [Planctomycetes bacterium]|nr:DUF456 domain-containing protein [Planctomycetota bacterium]MCP4838398.1 DUF456 domain-containing protein [Planctomycetota bacterium]